MAKTTLQLIEGYGPAEMGDQGWCFDRLCTAYDYVARKRIECNQVKKLMIHFVTREPDKTNVAVLGILSNFAIVSKSDLVALNNLQNNSEKFKFCFQFLSKAMLDFASQFCESTDAVDQVNRDVVNTQFSFVGTVKAKKTKGTSLAVTWALDRELTYAVTVSDNESIVKSIPFFRCVPRVIDHKKYFSKVDLSDNRVRIEKTGGGEYWEINADTENVEFGSKQAAEGHAHSQYQLAQYYLEGKVVARDLTRAALWAEKAEKQGFQRARALLREIRSAAGN
jgi:hypothetical protein